LKSKRFRFPEGTRVLWTQQPEHAGAARGRAANLAAPAEPPAEFNDD